VTFSITRLRAITLAATLVASAPLFAVTSGAAKSGASRGFANAAGAHSQPRVPGYLGIGFHDNNGHGVEVVVIDHDGPAGKIGLRPHDIILSMNAQPTNSASAVREMIHEYAPGLKVLLIVERDGQTLKMNTQIANRNEVERVVRLRVAADAAPPTDDPPVTDFSGDPATESAPSSGSPNRSFVKSMLHIAPFTGLGLQTMEPQLADYFGATQGFGLLVQMVVPNSPAAFSGLRAGDVLLRADLLPIKTASDWSKRLRANQGQPMVLTILRDKHEITLNLTPEARHHSLMEWPQNFQADFFQTLR
jgi:serine protease Do